MPNGEWLFQSAPMPLACPAVVPRRAPSVDSSPCFSLRIPLRPLGRERMLQSIDDPPPPSPFLQAG